LSAAARRLDVEATEAAIERIRSVDAVLADRLAAEASAFRFDRIVTAFNKAERQS
jgi:hypothetical protein